MSLSAVRSKCITGLFYYFDSVFVTAPGSVRLLRVTNSISNSTNKVIVSWHKPDGGDDIDQYYIEWYQNGSEHRSGYRYVNHVSRKFNYTFAITNILSVTKYRVWVVAKNFEGYGSYQSANITTGKSAINKFALFLMRSHKNNIICKFFISSK